MLRRRKKEVRAANAQGHNSWSLAAATTPQELSFTACNTIGIFSVHKRYICAPEMYFHRNSALSGRARLATLGSWTDTLSGRGQV